MTNRNAEPKRPIDSHGRFVSRRCPECGDGTLQLERADSAIYGTSFDWACDGLVDPENPNVELQACSYQFRHGDKFP